MELETTSNDGAPVPARGEGVEGASPDAAANDDVSPSTTAALDGDDAPYAAEDLFNYPVEITQRISQVSSELLRLREALVVERQCLARESEEVDALRTLDAQAQSQYQHQPQVQSQTSYKYEYEDTTSLYEPRDAAYIQAERRRHAQALIQKERYMKQMMEVEKMCSEEFFNLNQTRAKVNQLNREVSDWRLAHGQTTGFNLYPMEVMRSSDAPCQPGGGAASASIPGRFTVNQIMTSAGIKSVPNVSLPVSDMSSLSSSPSFDPNQQPWVQTFAGAVRMAPKGSKDASWRSGDAEDRLPPIVHF